MDQRTCSVEGCERKYYAKGWCPENVQMACWGHNRQKSNRMPSAAIPVDPAKGAMK